MFIAEGNDPDYSSPPLPLALQSRNPLAWLTIFGPGAVISSLTIGSGELIRWLCGVGADSTRDRAFDAGVCRRFSFRRETGLAGVLKGFLVPQPLAYPDWAFSQSELA